MNAFGQELTGLSARAAKNRCTEHTYCSFGHGLPRHVPFFELWPRNLLAVCKALASVSLKLEASRPLWLATPAAVWRSRTPSGLPGRDRTWSDVVGHCPEWSAGGRTLSEVAGACPDAVRSLESGRMGSERGTSY